MRHLWRIASVAYALFRLAGLSAHAATPSGVEFTDDRGTLVRLEVPPRRIVTLLPSLTETVCSLDACDRVVGTDRFSNWPDSVKALPKLGGLDDAQVERIFALKPDLVLAGKSTRVLDRLEALGLKVVALEVQTLPDTRRSIVRLARLLGADDAGTALLERFDARTRAAAARIPPAWRGARVYFEVAETPYAAGEASFIGELLQQLQMGNAIPAALGPFPKLNPEFVVRAQPEVIMAARSALRTMPQRPGWNAIRALGARQSCGFDPAQYDVLVRPGPRLAEAVDILADCIAQLPLRTASNSAGQGAH